MSGELIEITLGESKSLEGRMAQSFNNDSGDDEIRNSFHDQVPSFNFYSWNGSKVPSKYRVSNVHHCSSYEIYSLGDKIIVGEYCDEGIIVPRTHSIAFNQLYNCTPLISLIKGDEEYISFLHTWAIPRNSEVVDKQVKHWMETVAKFGDISETVFAPRKDSPEGYDTKYQSAIEDITRMSQKAIVLTRNVVELSGIANGEGVYFNDCGYHLLGKIICVNLASSPNSELDITSRLSEVQFPRKFFPRETELEKFSELKLNLGNRSATRFPYKPCYTPRRPTGGECNVVEENEVFRRSFSMGAFSMKIKIESSTKATQRIPL